MCVEREFDKYLKFRGTPLRIEWFGEAYHFDKNIHSNPLHDGSQTTKTETKRVTTHTATENFRIDDWEDSSELFPNVKTVTKIYIMIR